jgi:hypothetical protein
MPYERLEVSVAFDYARHGYIGSDCGRRWSRSRSTASPSANRRLAQVQL